MSSSFASQLPLAPLGAGDLIDRAVRLYRRHLFVLIRTAAPPVIIVAAGWILFSLSARRVFVTIPTWSSRLSFLGSRALPPEQEPVWVPVPSNVPDHADAPRVAELRRTLLAGGRQRIIVDKRDAIASRQINSGVAGSGQAGRMAVFADLHAFQCRPHPLHQAIIVIDDHDDLEGHDRVAGSGRRVVLHALHGVGGAGDQEIAERQKVPRKFLELILLELKRHGFVHSQRGRSGGYLLARPAGSISFGQYIFCLSGTLS